MHSPKTKLRIEPLESRQLMDAAGLASQIAPAWFESIADQTGAGHAGAATWTAEDTIISSTEHGAAPSSAAANLYDWIVCFDTASLAGVDSVAQTASLLAGGGIEFEVLRGLGLAGMVLVRSSGAATDAVEDWLTANVYVAAFEQDAYRTANTAVAANDPQAAGQWDMTAIDAQNAWSIATGSASVVVAVIDTGVDYNHVDLAANVWTNPGEVAGNGIDDDHNGFVDDVHGYDFANHDGSPMDDNGHGTHVAGTIAAVGNNGVGVTGVTWSTSIMALKFLNADGSGYLSDALAAVNYATMMRTQYGVNVRVDNNSWGGGSFSAAMQNAVAAANTAGILFVAAAGNTGANNDASPQYPANYDSPNVLSVAATAQNGQLASFSNYGASTVDIAAPGVSIQSTTPNNTYSTYSGTSMAAPHVSAVAALAWAVNPNATVAAVRSAILQGADQVAALAGKAACGGELNAYNTLRLLGGQPSATTPATTSPGATPATGIADDHGNSAAAATAISTPSSTSGKIGTAGDLDWFKFQAVAGKTYVFTVALGGLRDSVLYLYDAGGKKQLAFNDDYARSLASQITWTAKTGGVYYLAVGGYGNRYTGAYTLNVQVKGVAALSSAGGGLAARSVDVLPAWAAAQDSPAPWSAPREIVAPAALHDAALARLSLHDAWSDQGENLSDAWARRFLRMSAGPRDFAKTFGADERAAVDSVFDSLAENLATLW